MWIRSGFAGDGGINEKFYGRFIENKKGRKGIDLDQGFLAYAEAAKDVRIL